MSGFDINSVTVSGNLTREPELRNLPNGGQSVCSLRIAHNDRYKDASGNWADRASYFDVSVWGGLGEWMANNLSKGQKVVVSGRLKWREWGEEGSKRQAVDISADSVVPVVRDGQGGGGGGNRSGGQGADGFTPRSDVPSNTDDFQQPVPSGAGQQRQPLDDDIPF
jgi:single-strand DNA-binding protein